MCTSPLRIFNPRKNLTYRDKIWLDVPCGQCAECRKKYQNDWFVRTYFEFLGCRYKNGTTIYVTLTYNESCKPLFGEVPCFSRRDVQLFLKRLRKAVKLYLGHDCVRYIITSEYGGETHRPHYHGLIFFYYPNLRPYQISELKHIITVCWSSHGGFVHFGRKGNYKIRGVVENSAAVSYVAKYLGKDMSFPYKYDDNGESMYPREVLPFHLQSKGFGQYMIEHFGLSDNTVYAFNMLVQGTFCISSINSSQFTYGIPQYITRKILYDYVYKLRVDTINLESAPYILKVKTPEVSYNLNEYGLKVKRERELHSLEYRVNEFDKIFRNVEKILQKDFDPSEVDIVCSRCMCTLRDANSMHIIDMVNDTWLTWSDNDRLAFVCYTSLFKDRVFIPNSQFGLSDSFFCLNDAMLYLDEIYSLDVASIDNYELTQLKEYSTIQLYKSAVAHSTYASSLHDERYPIYEDLLRVFNAIIYILGLRDERKKLESQRQYDNAKLGVAYVV